MKEIGLILISFCLVIVLPAQAGLEINAGNREMETTYFASNGLTPGISFPSISANNPFMPGKSIFPAYVLDNPTGYSYFCRLELAVEKKLPVGLWIKIDENPTIDNGPINQAYFRMKLLRF